MIFLSLHTVMFLTSDWFIVQQIEKIRIGHDGANPGSGWFLDEVRIDVPSKGEKYVFACHRWLDTKEEDGQLEIEMEPTHYQKGAASAFFINYTKLYSFLALFFHNYNSSAVMRINRVSLSVM